MAPRQLIHRLVGITAICLSSLLTPLSAYERVLVLAVFGFGIVVGALAPRYDRLAARIVGSCSIIVSAMIWSALSLVALSRLARTRAACLAALPFSASSLFISRIPFSIYK